MENDNKLKLSFNIALISGIFCVTVALLLLLNFMQMIKSKPLESKALISLVQRLGQEPNSDELKQEIRDFDLLARKAYFNTQWQVKTGGYLLLFGSIILAFSLRIFIGLRARIEEPEVNENNEFKFRIFSSMKELVPKSRKIVWKDELLWEFVKKCLVWDPHLRLTPSQAMLLPVFKSKIEINSKSLNSKSLKSKLKVKKTKNFIDN